MLLNNSAVAAKPCIKAQIACQRSSPHATLDRGAFFYSDSFWLLLQNITDVHKNNNFKKENNYRSRVSWQLLYKSAKTMEIMSAPAESRVRLKRWQMVSWGRRIICYFCQVSGRTLTVFDSVLRWLCINWTLTNGQWDRAGSMCVHKGVCPELVKTCRTHCKEQIWRVCVCVCACVCIYALVCFKRCAHIFWQSDCCQQCADGCTAWMTPPLDSGLEARTPVIT